MNQLGAALSRFFGFEERGGAMTSLFRCVHLAVFWAAAAASFTGQACALDVEVASDRIEPGERQAVTVSGLGRGVSLDLAWIDPTGRVRLAWDLTANRRGRAAVRFRTAGALPGRHRDNHLRADPAGPPCSTRARARSTLFPASPRSPGRRRPPPAGGHNARRP